MFKTILLSIGILCYLWCYYTTLQHETESLRSIKNSIRLVYNIQGLKLKLNSTYIKNSIALCVPRDSLKLTHPDVVLEDFYIYRHQAHNDTVRLEIRKNYFDAQPYHEVFQTKPLVQHTDKKVPDYTNVFINSILYNKERHTSQFCLTDIRMHFPSPNILDNKIDLAVMMNKQLEHLWERNVSQECLRDAQFQKKSFILSDPKQCKQFFEIANQQYNHSSTEEIFLYVKKNNEHNQEGTELAFKKVMLGIQEQFDYGRNCDNPPTNLIMQEYIKNPVLFKGRKFDIRMHIIVISSDPLILYLYQRFYLMKCLYKFDNGQFKNHSHICSAGYQRKLLNSNEYDLLLQDEEILEKDQITEQVTYEQFADYLIQEGKIKNRDWVETYLKPEMEKRFYHYFQGYFDQFGELPDPRYGMYKACEFNVDDNLNFWLLECTPMPNMIPPPKGVMKDFQTEMNFRGLKLIQLYQRQKFRRYQQLIKKLEVLSEGQSYDELSYNQKRQLMNLTSEYLKQVPIISSQIDPYWHRVDLERARQVCN